MLSRAPHCAQEPSVSAPPGAARATSPDDPNPPRVPLSNTAAAASQKRPPPPDGPPAPRAAGAPRIACGRPPSARASLSVCVQLAAAHATNGCRQAKGEGGGFGGRGARERGAGGRLRRQALSEALQGLACARPSAARAAAAAPAPPRPPARRARMRCVHGSGTAAATRARDAPWLVSGKAPGVQRRQQCEARLSIVVQLKALWVAGQRRGNGGV